MPTVGTVSHVSNCCPGIGRILLRTGFPVHQWWWSPRHRGYNSRTNHENQQGYRGRSKTFVLGFGVPDRPPNHFRRRRPGLKPIIKKYVLPFYLTKPRLPGDIRSSTIVTGYTNRTLFGAKWRRWFQRYSLIFCDTLPYTTYSWWPYFFFNCSTFSTCTPR